mmetsp:Transcript_26188/g.74435  ORF Transcript_26188/g.74435 Transcript_26188/m.74435 type:complete len:244 (-) Transcript_26188:26-757(-)
MSSSSSSMGAPHSSSVTSMQTVRTYHASSAPSCARSDRPRTCCHTLQSSPDAFRSVRRQETGAPLSCAIRNFASSKRERSPSPALSSRPLPPTSAGADHPVISWNPFDTAQMRPASAPGSASVAAKRRSLTTAQRASQLLSSDAVRWSSATHTSGTEGRTCGPAPMSPAQDSPVVARDHAEPKSPAHDSAVVARDHAEGSRPHTSCFEDDGATIGCSCCAREAMVRIAWAKRSRWPTVSPMVA